MRLAFDIGGTFTDVVFFDDDRTLRDFKLLSQLETVGADIAGLAAELGGGATPAFVHATTICSNSVIEGKGASVALITTRGFRDILEMRGQRRPAIYNFDWDRLPPVVPRTLRLEVTERLTSNGEVDIPLDLAQVEQASEKLRDAGVAAVAICFINSHVNSAHERQAAELLARSNPDLAVCSAGDDFCEIGEYERMSTVAVNATLVPVVERYLARLEGQLHIPHGELPIMQSSGGLQSSRIMRRLPVRMIESGPAAGVLAAAQLAREMHLDRVLSLDMGGTTAKASLIIGGEPSEKPSTEVGGGASLVTRMYGGQGHIVRVPSLDIVEVGAGGGSLAWIDRGGGLRVGPQGAGAEPGPACYGRGGSDPTVTDANVTVGYMNPQAIAAGTVPIDHAAAKESIRDQIAAPLEMSVEEAALGILRVADATMMRATRAVSIERGVDPRGLTLVAFGGSGPLHAARLAQALGIKRVIVPILPGVFSALGLLLAEFRQDAARSLLVPVDVADRETLEQIYADLERAVSTTLEEGIGRPAGRFVREIDVQYQHQTTPLTLTVTDRQISDLTEAFHDRHMAEYGFVRDDKAQIVALRVKGIAPASDLSLRDIGSRIQRSSARDSTPPAIRSAYFGADHGWLEMPILNRSSDMTLIAGPAAIEESGSCVLVPPGWSVASDPFANLILSYV